MPIEIICVGQSRFLCHISLKEIRPLEFNEHFESDFDLDERSR